MATIVVTCLFVALFGCSPPPANCTIVGGEAAERAYASKYCALGRYRFSMIFGHAAPAVVTIDDSLGFTGDVVGETARLRFASSRRWARSDSAIHSTTYRADEFDAETILSHELAHVLLAAWYFEDVPRDSVERYGTPLPDWFDEAVAVWAEPDEIRLVRLSRARRHARAGLGLAQLLITTHPGLERMLTNPRPIFTRVTTVISNCHVAGCPPRPKGDTLVIERAQYADGSIRVDTLASGDRALEEQATDRFYEVTGSLLAFLYDRGGPAVIQELVARMRSGHEPAKMLSALPGLPSDIEGVEAAWREWLLGQPDLEQLDSARPRQDL